LKMISYVPYHILCSFRNASYIPLPSPPSKRSAGKL
jgi:hypothetical protein